MISIKNEREIEFMRESNRIVGEVLFQLGQMIKPGISTKDLNARAGEIISENKATAEFNGFSVDGLKPYPYNICASLNNEIVHGYSSSEKILKDGDIISIDVGTRKNGFCGDGARTFAVGKISAENKKLMDVTQLALERAIKKCVVGNRIGDISAIIEQTAKENNLFVAENLTGHGVGRELHEDPIVFNSGKKNKGPRLKKGMTIAIEPMFSIGTSKIIEHEWVYLTADNSNAAHFENTILITENKPEILTKFSNGKVKYNQLEKK